MSRPPGTERFSATPPIDQATLPSLRLSPYTVPPSEPTTTRLATTTALAVMPLGSSG